jgi:FKBP-type peptidyl-prolyl cis-trans isomerase
MDRLDEGVSTLETTYEPWSKMRPIDGQIVQINLVICLIDGTLVEDSRKRMGETPFSFVLGSTDVIEGINIAVRNFGQGERSTVKICSELAYGDMIHFILASSDSTCSNNNLTLLTGYDGLSPLIPPNADLICDIELVDFRNVS